MTTGDMIILIAVFAIALLAVGISIHYDNKKYDKLHTMALDEYYRGYAEGKRDANN